MPRPQRRALSLRPRAAQARVFTRTSRVGLVHGEGRGAERCVTARAPTSPRGHAAEPCALVHGNCRHGEHRESAPPTTRVTRHRGRAQVGEHPGAFVDFARGAGHAVVS